ncbi:MAG TPA: TonB family protein [Bryobacteraceae bacterium]|nr:TonB family protein [Bryobacteraceae bacterium]
MRSAFLPILLATFAIAQPSPQGQRILDLTEAIARKPDFAAAYYGRGVTYLELRQYSAAINDLTKAIGLTLSDASAYAKRAEAYGGLNRHDEEIADLTAALGIKPRNVMFYLQRANAHSLSGHCDLSIPDYSQVIAAFPTVEAYRGRAACRKQLGDASGALDDENGAVELSAKMSAILLPSITPIQGQPAGPPTLAMERPGGMTPEPKVVDPMEGGSIYRIGGGVSQPSLIFKCEPEYSEEARKAKWQGTVALSIVVDQYGETRNLKVVKSLGLGLDEEAVEAVRRWVFRPGRKEGAPVAVYATIQVTFNLL